MNEYLGQFDLFFVFRRLLVVFCTVYAAVRIGQTWLRWLAYLYRPERPAELLRRYVSLHLLRVRWHRFWPDYVHIGALGGFLILLIYLHHSLPEAVR